LYEEYLRVRRTLANSAHGLRHVKMPQATIAQQQLTELSDRKEQLERELAGAVPGFARRMSFVNADHNSLVAAMPDGAVLVDIVHYHDCVTNISQPREGGFETICSYVAFVLSRRGVTRVEIGPASAIDAAIAAWRTTSEGEVEADARMSALLRRILWEPVQAALPPDGKEIYLCADGPLTSLPWGALPGRTPDRALLDDYALALVPSGRFLLQQLTESGTSAGGDGPLLVVGGVDFGTPRQESPVTPTAGSPESGANPKPWSQLLGTEQELSVIRTLAGTRERIELGGVEASVARTLQELPCAHWAHFATHGFFADQRLRSFLQLDEGEADNAFPLFRRNRHTVSARNPLLLSGLVLAGANLPRELDELGFPVGDGGILTAEVIAGLPLENLRLVVLSACETGLGDVAGGEGVLGLQRAFHIAGARNVVASLWKVDDHVTAVLMEQFYRNLWVGKMHPIEALRQAQLYVYRHPEAIESHAGSRGPDFAKAAKLPGPATPAGTAKTVPAHLWAGFVLSGAGQ